MHLVERDRGDPTPAVEAPTEEGPALRDAIAATERAAADETEAGATRVRLATYGLPAIDADEAIGPHLVPDERVHSLRPRAILSVPGGDRALGYGGTLYLTSRRLVHLGQVVVNVQLTDIEETSLAGELLLLSLREGEGISLNLDRPRVLRAEIAEATRGMRQ